MKTEILYEDKSIFVIRKPAGLAVQSARVGQPDVVSELKTHIVKQSGAGKGEPYLGVIHRLDQPVEGLLVFAKDKKAAAALTKQLGAGTLNKQYYAVICGYPEAEEGELVDSLRKDGNMTVVVTGQEEQFPDAKRARLTYRVLKKAEEPRPLSLVDICIETGRFHQIRAQFAHAGLPLFGDTKYGNADAATALTGYRGVALCAYALEFRHPVTGKAMNFRVEPKNPAFAYFSDKLSG